MAILCKSMSSLDGSYIPESEVKRILAKLDFMRFLEEQFRLEFYETRGGWFNAPCPLGGEHFGLASFGVHVSGGWNCPECKRKGFAPQFLREKEGLTLPQAIRRLADWMAEPIQGDVDADRQRFIAEGESWD